MNFRSYYQICPCCKGEGELQDPLKSERSIIKCRRCNATGKIIVYCPEYYIEIPAGDKELIEEFEKQTNRIEEIFFDAKAKLVHAHKKS